MKDIYHVITTINRGGAENQLLVLVDEQIRRGYRVCIVYLKGEPELKKEFVGLGAEVIDSVSKLSTFKQPFAIAKLISKKDVVLHAHLPRAELISLLIPAKLRLITSRHNAEPFFPGAPKFLSNRLGRLVEMRASKIIANSQSVKDFLVQRGEVKNSEKVHVIYYGYQIKNLDRSEPFKRIHRYSNLGTISRLAHQKDLPTMISSFKKFKDEFPDATLSIVGAGPLENELRVLVMAFGLESEIHFLGRRHDVMNFLSTLDVFLLTSKYEGFGMVLLEAMDAGIPIVASRNSAIVEVLGVEFPGLCETGNPSDFASKALRLQNSNYKRDVLKFQEERLAIFTASSMVEKVIECYSP